MSTTRARPMRLCDVPWAFVARHAQFVEERARSPALATKLHHFPHTRPSRWRPQPARAAIEKAGPISDGRQPSVRQRRRTGGRLVFRRVVAAEGLEDLVGELGAVLGAQGGRLDAEDDAVVVGFLE